MSFLPLLREHLKRQIARWLFPDFFVFLRFLVALLTLW